jgi:inosine-uridine nucleoside N-ribohydrolase
MFGSINREHLGKEGAIAEFNVKEDIPACQTVFNAPWKSMTITPLDTCGIVRLKGELYRKVAQSDDPIANDVIENYRIWLKAGGEDGEKSESTVLFDTVAVHLAYSTDYLKMEKMRIRIDDAGFTVVDDDAREINVATDWIDLDAYQEYLADRLIAPLR